MSHISQFGRRKDKSSEENMQSTVKRMRTKSRKKSAAATAESQQIQSFFNKPAPVQCTDSTEDGSMPDPPSYVESPIAEKEEAQVETPAVEEPAPAPKKQRKRRKVTSGDALPALEKTRKTSVAAAKNATDQLDQCKQNAENLLAEMMTQTRVFRECSGTVLRAGDVMTLLDEMLKPSLGPHTDVVRECVAIRPNEPVAGERMETDVEEKFFDRLDVETKRMLLAVWLNYTEIMAPAMEMLKPTFHSVLRSIKRHEVVLEDLQKSLDTQRSKTQRIMKNVIENVSSQVAVTTASTPAGGHSNAGFRASGLFV